MRPLVSYDDITTPRDSNSTHGKESSTASRPPPPKRRKTNSKSGGTQVQHWDDPGGQPTQMNYDDPVTEATSVSVHAQDEGEIEEEAEEGEEEESRELTHDEIWDDSALIDAWNSAAAEYEALHGSGKSWKDEPVKKSPLWYNVPPAPTSKEEGKIPSASTSKSGPSSLPNGRPHAPHAGEAGDNSAPLNFDTFVPTHDPSLASLDASEHNYASWQGPAGPLVDQDEAFQRALTAMYWGGYWTAVYHYRRQESAREKNHDDEDEQGEEDEEVYADADEDMIPAQR